MTQASLDLMTPQFRPISIAIFVREAVTLQARKQARTTDFTRACERGMEENTVDSNRRQVRLSGMHIDSQQVCKRGRGLVLCILMRGHNAEVRHNAGCEEPKIGADAVSFQVSTG